MRRIISLSFILLLIGGVLSACSSTIANTEKPSNTITAQDFAFIGAAHNRILHKTYNYLRKSSNLKEAKKGIKRFIIKQTYSNVKYSQKRNKYFKRRKELAGSYLKTIDFTNPKVNKTVAAGTNKSNAIDTLSTIVKSYLDRLHEVVNNSKKSNFIENISTLENEIQNNKKLTKAQLATLYSATETAKYSLKYWTDNLKKWKALASANDQISAMETNLPIAYGFWGDLWDTVKHIGVKDAEGAAVMAASTWIVNAIPVIGNMEYGANIVAGAVGASLWQGLQEAGL